MQVCISVGIEKRPLDREAAVVKVGLIVAQMQKRVLF